LLEIVLFFDIVRRGYAPRNLAVPSNDVCFVEGKNRDNDVFWSYCSIGASCTSDQIGE